MGAAPPPPYCTDQGVFREVSRPAEGSCLGVAAFLFTYPLTGYQREKLKKEKPAPFPPSAPMGDGGNGRPSPQSLRVSQNLAGVKGRKNFFLPQAQHRKNFSSPCGALDTAENLPEGTIFFFFL